MFLSSIAQPSRELAEQTFQQIKKFKRYLSAPCPRDVLLVGGVAAREQSEALRQGVDLVVATPGRLEDLVDQGALVLSHCCFFVLDECVSSYWQRAGVSRLGRRAFGSLVVHDNMLVWCCQFTNTK